MRLAILLAVVALMLARPALCDEGFKDVPKDHWAAEFVKVVKADGIMKGYPDATFKGDKPITRYELAVALERMVEFVEQGLKPEADRQKAVQSGKSKAESQKAPSGDSTSVGNAKAAPSPSIDRGKPKVDDHDPAQALKSGGYIASDSPLLTNKDKTVSPSELSQALASVAARLVEKTIPPPKD